MAVLELDVGNTRLNWRAISPLTSAAGDILRLDVSNEDVVAQLFDAVAGISFDRVCVASVAGSEFSRALSCGCEKQKLPDPEFAYVSAEAAGVVCAYTNVANLGVDRWLAVLAAHHMTEQGAIVVDCGSAVTVDVVSLGRHLGGYIVPGVRLMVESLFRGTDGVKVPREFDGDLAPGGDTAEAVNRGVVQMVVGLVRQAVSQWPGARAGVPILLTGGDAEFMRPAIEGEIESVDVLLCPDLVMDGLRYCKTQPLKV